MKYIINIETNFDTNCALEAALEDLASQIRHSNQAVGQPGKGHGYMGVYCNHATVQCRYFVNIDEVQPTTEDTCLRCSRELTPDICSAEFVETGICADCWTTEDERED